MTKFLETITIWGNQWKMSFNPASTEIAQEIVFSRANNTKNHPPLFFNNFLITLTFQKFQFRSIPQYYLIHVWLSMIY